LWFKTGDVLNNRAVETGDAESPLQDFLRVQEIEPGFEMCQPFPLVRQHML
jgi:hypothetical protein